MELRDHLITMNATGFVGINILKKIEKRVGSLDELIKMDVASIQLVSGLNYKTCLQIHKEYKNRTARKELELAEQHGITLTTIVEEGYPGTLRQLESPPLAIYMMGSLDADRSIAIVGSRGPSYYGIKAAEAFTKAFAVEKITTVSGLAVGIDTIAHKNSINNTVAVLGSGLLNVYPYQNRRLAGQIMERGAVVSEYPLEKSPSPANFPMRNRIIAALSDCTLVVQAGLTSGALITADWSARAGKEVYCVPGPVTDPISFGCNYLIKEGARIAINPSQIISEVWGAAPGLTEAEEIVLSHTSTDRGFRELIKLTGIKERVLGETIKRLVSRGLIKRTVAGRFINS